MRCFNRLYKTDTPGELVEEHDPRGRLLFCKPGDEIPDELAREYGLLPHLKEQEQEIKAVEPEEVENKMADKPENKMINAEIKKSRVRKTKEEKELN